MRGRPVEVSVLIALVLAACAPDPGDSDTPFVPDLPTGGCGAEPYDWAPMAGMGGILDWEPAYAATAAQIDAALAGTDLASLAPVPYGVRVFRVRYRTQDRGAPVEATGLISFPDADGAFPTVLWTHPTMGWRDACAPSAQGPGGALGNLLVSSQGYAVAAPDYLGMAGWGAPSGRLHPWIVPEPTAVASLDAVRALWEFSDDGLDEDGTATAERRVVAWGASEGGFGALWSDRYAAYLPEAQWVATVGVVPPTDLLGMTTHATNHFETATAAVVGVLTANHDWYGGEEPLTDVFVEAIASELPEAMQCDTGDLFDGVTTHERIYAPDFLAAARAGAWDGQDPWGCYLERATLARTEVPRAHDAPVLIVIAEEDDLVVAEPGRADIPRLCEAGYALDAVVCDGANHAEGAGWSMPYQFAWVADRFAGVARGPDTCVDPEPVDCKALP